MNSSQCGETPLKSLVKTSCVQSVATSMSQKKTFGKRQNNSLFGDVVRYTHTYIPKMLTN